MTWAAMSASDKIYLGYTLISGLSSSSPPCGSHRTLFLLAPHAIDLLRPHQKELPLRRGGRGVIGIAEVVDGQHLVLRAALDDVALAGADEREIQLKGTRPSS